MQGPARAPKAAAPAADETLIVAPTPTSPLPASPPPASEAPRETPLPNFEALARNIALLVEEGGKVLAAYLQAVERAASTAEPSRRDLAQMVATLGRVAEYYYADAQRALQAQSRAVGPVPRIMGRDLAPAARRRGGAVAAPDLATSASPIRSGATIPISISSSRPMC